LTLLKTGGRNLESEKLGSYFAGIMFAYGFLLIALIISLLNRIITRKWLKNIYTTTWYILVFVIFITIYGYINQMV
jgi:glucan phosphoethanolaminetransferase (alkaline phosphatase superfamily)